MNRPLRIVVADDEADMRDYFARVLPRLGHSVVAVAESGEELLAQCRAARPDLVITDVKMPGLSGFEAAQHLHEELSLPVLLVTAHPDRELLQRAETDYRMCYLVKPIKQADLSPAIVRTMNRFVEAEAARSS